MMTWKGIHEIFEHNRSPSQFSVGVFIEHEIITNINQVDSGYALMERNSGTDNPKPWEFKCLYAWLFNAFYNNFHSTLLF